MNRVFIRGDTHGDYQFLDDFCRDNNTTTEDILIILGDNAIRFEGPNSIREQSRKDIIKSRNITIFALRGNHDRPYNIGKDVVLMDCPLLVEGDNKKMWHDISVPNVWYFQDGATYIIKGKSYLTIGGAYSIDKDYRLQMHRTWFPEEQLTIDEQFSILANVFCKSFDYVLTHTCPVTVRPVYLFLSGIDQSKVDLSMENFLQKIMENIKFKHWYFGHYHSDENKIFGLDNMTLLYNNIIEIKEED